MENLNFLNEKERQAVLKYKNFLFEEFPEKIVNFYLFGSKARGDYHKESDIDILITLKDYDWKLGDEIRRIGYELDEDIDYKFSILIFSDSDFEKWKSGRFQFVKNVFKDGVPI
ncbi:MAG: nucleotidyltransferase domain-containing protein [Leptospiraceae bacterium]|nr:nucleotidyltransferase domain-containing protein [Leptospiraceae bacterium]